ncbi:MAG TPA: hypothetical protein VFO76_12260, partial [Candidatus Kapabacteria bacterium]|nr:hypothetical protein [Candidatus Kapabacteria bacterium]
IIKKESNYAFIGAGCGNYIHDTVTTIAGGESNTVLAFGGTIGGGAGNLVDAIDGRTHTNNNEAAYGSILGGQSNLITKHPTSEIAILPVGYNMPVYGTIGGGFFDTLCGHFGVIGGGMQNRAFGAFGTIPGGLGLKAYDWQTVIGLYNTEIKRLNNTSLTINLPIATDRLFVVGNGVSEGARSNAFEISQSGHSTVFEVAGNNSTGVQGGTYRDNTVEAWGECIQTNNVGPVFSFSTFGCTVTRVNTGIYRVTMNVLDPTTGASLTLTNISVTATLYMNGNIDGGGCYHIQVENKNTLIPSCQFDIHIKDQDCHDKDNSFMFHVTGR